MTVMGLLPLARLPGSTWQLLARRCAPILKKQLPTTAAAVHDGHHQSKRYLYTEGLKSYNQMYGSSIHDKDNFWKTVAGHLHFKTPSDKGLEWNFDYRKGDIFIHFMKGAYTNAAYNCLERNIDRGYGSKVAYYWEGNEPADSTQITYQELADKVSAFAEVLRSCGIRKGDVVAIYLPMILELPISMLACAHIGAVHSVVFAGFGADALASRLVQAKAKVLVACDGYFHGKKLVHAKSVVDAALGICKQKNHHVGKTIVVRHLDRVHYAAKTPLPELKLEENELCFDKQVEKFKGKYSVTEWTEAEDPLFILYTSGSTGKPKGVVHTTAGYMTYAYATTKYVFDTHPDTDIYWCTADCGWITGHSYLVYGPLMNGLTSVMFEGIPTYPTPSRMWETVEKYKVTTLYTAPTAIRSLMAQGDEHVLGTDRSSLRILGSVGEPINPAAWRWFHGVAGGDHCEVVDTYWQTETGGHVIAPLPGTTPTKPGSATLPFFGIRPALVDENGIEIYGPGEGKLCIKRAWPGICRDIYNDHNRYLETYFKQYPGFFFTGDGARRDEDGYLWITGRVDDLMNVSGHLLSTAEIESVLASDKNVVEAAVVAASHDIKGSHPYAFVTLKKGCHLDKERVRGLKQLVRQTIGPIAVPDAIQEAPSLPKTRSGKVTRRILRLVAEGDPSADLGDTSTLINAWVISKLWQGRLSTRTRIQPSFK